MRDRLRQFVRGDEGQDLIEYAFLASAIALGAIAATELLGVTLNNWYSAAARATQAGSDKATTISF